MHKIGCALTKQTSFLCLRLALFLHKIGCASTKQTVLNAFGGLYPSESGKNSYFIIYEHLRIE
ncbi:hypothetical protein CJ231_07000 [Hoylesella buccalis]|uniref:Uncharacterized protein n=1 Tax=Hoylesella buccalis TaxID=28127 RepID=A0A2N6QQL1_9BACT|nr:hypothetical protein CJ231_07000 [Hoylesella buccalis]